MTRAVVFKTATKLDLRALTVFGMNAKPNSNSPIGYFGTGLKYAMAVLARERIPVTIITAGTQWSVKAAETEFRGKEFQAVKLIRHKKLLPDTVRDLPFTTELGKNWKLWQAFRELYSNTIDENGEAYIGTQACDIDNIEKGSTYIIVEGEAMVAEYFDREKSFLPDALRQQATTNEYVQVFDKPSKHIYYRGIRILDMPEGMNSELTYNILQQLQLTEDRTASEWEVKNIIAKHAQKTEDKRVVSAVVLPREKSFEAGIDFDYTYITPSDTFHEVVKANKDKASAAAVRRSEVYRPEPKVKPTDPWLEKLIALLEDPDNGSEEAHHDIIEAMFEDTERMIEILQEELADPRTKSNIVANAGAEVPGSSSMTTTMPSATINTDMKDEIPF